MFCDIWRHSWRTTTVSCIVFGVLLLAQCEFVASSPQLSAAYSKAAVESDPASTKGANDVMADPPHTHASSARALVTESMDSGTRTGLAVLLTVGVVLIGMGIAYFVFKKGTNPRDWGKSYAEIAKRQSEQIEAEEAKKASRHAASSDGQPQRKPVVDEDPRRLQGDFSRSSRRTMEYPAINHVHVLPRGAHSTGNDSFGVENDDRYWDGVVDGFHQRQSERNQVFLITKYVFREIKSE
jgi:hypothetical protein